MERSCIRIPAFIAGSGTKRRYGDGVGEKTVIGLILFPDATQLDLTAPYEVFARIPNSEIYIVSDTLDPVRTERGLQIVPNTTYDTCPTLNVLFVPGGPGQIAAQHNKKLMKFIAEYADTPDVFITSVCTGALLLGAAGLLQNKKATTHWSCMDILPYMGAIPVNTPVVEDGKIITGAGVTNGIDLALYVAEKLGSKEVAERIARQVEYPHISQHANKAHTEQLSYELLAANPYRKARLEAARETAKQLGVSIAL